MRGTRCNLVIRQGEAEGYKPILYIESTGHIEGTGGSGVSDLEKELKEAVDQDFAPAYPGLALKKLDEGRWILEIPGKYKVGHEAHFGQVTEKYLEFLFTGTLPEWEIPNMIVKYYTTTQGMKKALE